LTLEQHIVLQNYLYSILIKSYKVGIKCKPLFRNYLYSTLIKGFKIGLKSIPHINVHMYIDVYHNDTTEGVKNSIIIPQQ